MIIGVLGAALVAALWAGGALLYQHFYSPTAFVERYLGMLSDRDAADALAVPGVAIDSADLADSSLPEQASDALLRRDALAALTDVEVVSEQIDGEVTLVTVDYRAGAYQGTTTFEVERDGWIGIAPTWRFARSPLAVIDLTVNGSMSFDVNGFEIDKRQVSPDGVDADPLEAVPLLVFSPGVYSISVDTAISATPGVAVLSDSPFHTIPVSVQATATEEFVEVVQERVVQFLESCASQQVLQPTACPFGYLVQDRIVAPPTWSISAHPAVTVEPAGAGWRIPPTEAVARIAVDIQSLFDGSITAVDEDVPFIVTADITVRPDGTASIVVTGPDTR
ncbi:hypothetical protein HQM25_17095 [Microbacterium hominis]|uniref:Uncharacterized protein n=1 Tax=Microbacterium hominis TaxID=162426 RepID=A0A7D4PWF0_9MICO|nr:hypothetical protein [Microbacterium hominis]QKJ21313.1 hypothetical protein HQM25_17095 [Microbacterium hominis]